MSWRQQLSCVAGCCLSGSSVDIEQAACYFGDKAVFTRLRWVALLLSLFAGDVIAAQY